MSYSINSESIRVHLRHLEPLVLTGADGSLRVLEKSGRCLCGVPSDGVGDGSAVALKIEELFSARGIPSLDPPIQLRIHVVSDALALEELCSAVTVLAALLKPKVLVQLVFHFGEAPVDWCPLLSTARRLRETFQRPGELPIQAIGPFGVATEKEMDLLGNLGVRITFAAGWAKGCCRNGLHGVDHEALRRFASVGFRVPVTWYVHADNINDVERELPDILDSNYDSGLGLPLVSCSPYYHFGDGVPDVPDAIEYCGLLVRGYNRYPFYDDVFTPLEELALLVRNEGWNAHFDLPVVIQVLIRADGSLAIYRQTPALCAPWMSLSALLSFKREVACESLICAAVEAWHWRKNQNCCGCCWRYICGGRDTPAQPNARIGEWDALCAHRKLFIEHFARVRAPDCIAQNAQRNA